MALIILWVLRSKQRTSESSIMIIYSSKSLKQLNTVKTDCCSNQFDWLYEFHLLNNAFSYVVYEVANTIFLIENTMFTFRCKHVYYVPI